jgi:hypothetical protein
MRAIRQSACQQQVRMPLSVNIRENRDFRQLLMRLSEVKTRGLIETDGCTVTIRDCAALKRLIA